MKNNNSNTQTIYYYSIDPNQKNLLSLNRDDTNNEPDKDGEKPRKWWQSKEVKNEMSSLFWEEIDENDSNFSFPNLYYGIARLSVFLMLIISFGCRYLYVPPQVSELFCRFT